MGGVRNHSTLKRWKEPHNMEKTEKLSLKEIVNKLTNIRKYINQIVLERESETESALIAVMTGESCLLIGDPGSAKTQHIHLVSEMLGLTLFNTLLSESTKPESIFGPVDVPALAKGIQRTKIDGYAPTAELVFLDEVFKANGIVLNPLLWFLNEHKYRNGDEGIIDCPTIAVFAASNEIPTDEALRPVYDRFLLRHEVTYIRSTSNLSRMFNNVVRFDQEIKRPEPLTKREVMALRKSVKKVTITQEIWDTMVTIRNQIKVAVGIDISDRRMAKSIRLIQATALLNGRSNVRKEDLEVLSNVFWNTLDQIRKVRAIVITNAGSLKGDIVSYVETAESVFDKAIKTGGLSEGLKKIRNILAHTKQFETANGRKIHSSIQEYGRKLRDMLLQRQQFQVIIMEDENGDEWFKLAESCATVWTAKQLRSVGFKWKRSLGYWWMPPSKRLSQRKVTLAVKKTLKVDAEFMKLT